MQPIAPRSKTNPSGTTRLIQGAERQLRKRLKSVRDGAIAWLERQPLIVTEMNSRQYNAAYYEFRLDDLALINLSDELDRLISLYVYNPTESRRQYFMSQYATLAYEEGTAGAIENISAQVAYPITVEQVVTSQPYQDRIAVTSSRVFEQMAGFSAAMKADLSRILTEGMTEGKSPRVIASQIRDQMNTEYSRAKRIARTEINNAHRQAIYSEDLRADRLRVQTRIMHFSALIPGRTRKTHAERHGKIVTREEEQEWYSKDANSVNCLCTPLSVVTDIHGKPISEAFVKRQLEARKKFSAVAVNNACGCC